MNNVSFSKLNEFDLSSIIRTSGSGEYKIVLNATDLSGNKALQKEIQFIVDYNKAQVSITPISNITNNGFTNMSKVELNASVTDDWALYNSRYSITRNNSPYNIGVNVANWSSVSFPFDLEGFYELEVTTDDKAQNGEVSDSFSFTLDKTAPSNLQMVGQANHHGVNTSLEDGKSYSTPQMNLTLSANDEYSIEKMVLTGTKNNTNILQVANTLNAVRTDFTSTFTRSFTKSFTEEGKYELTLAVDDKSGNKSMCT